MSLLWKDDWDATKERFKAWWAHEYFGRCAIAVTAPRNDAPATPEPARPPTPELRWSDLDYISALSDWENARTFFGGEAFPGWGYGYPGNAWVPTFLGSPVTLDWNTGWNDPILTGEEIGWRSLRLDAREPSYRFYLDWLRRAAMDAKGKCIPGIGAIGGCGDTLAALRGTDRLLYDVIDRPDEVRAAEDHLMDVWIAVYSRAYDIIHDAAEGSTCWFGLWSPGKFYAAQNDFSYSIGPKMFRDIFLPAIEKQTAFLDHSIYHVDGVAAFVHVDALAELPRLQALQILPGAGKPSPLHYVDVLRKVQSAGKNLHISIEPREVKSALDALSARGLFIRTSCDDEGAARALLKSAERWSVDRG